MTPEPSEDPCWAEVVPFLLICLRLRAMSTQEIFDRVRHSLATLENGKLIRHQHGRWYPMVSIPTEIEMRACACCGKPVIPKQPNRFCSPQCRGQMRRQKEKKDERRIENG